MIFRVTIHDDDTEIDSRTQWLISASNATEAAYKFRLYQTSYAEFDIDVQCEEERLFIKQWSLPMLFRSDY